MISYIPLWTTLVKRKMKRGDLYKILSPATVARMGRDEYVSLQIIDKVCDFLDCEISDVVVRDSSAKKESPNDSSSGQ